VIPLVEPISILERDARLLDDLDDDESSPLASWALNFVLGLLGATVLGLAFMSFDRDDPRYLYNPWTYAVIVPVVLVMLSAVMSTLVSRIVRRSMQAAFLLSVLAHLLILTYFSNIVIHSRLWPQLFDSFAQQRRVLKLEALQAKQYVKTSVATQPNRRPDYLRPVPTEHQPTEIPLAEERKIQLAINEVSQLVSPKLELEKSTTPHLLKRTDSQKSTPSFSPQASQLSRSELSQMSPEPNAGPSYEIFQSEPELQASKADSLGARSRQSKDSPPLAAPTSLAPATNRENPSPSTPSLQRKPANDVPTLEMMAATDLPRRSSEAKQPSSSGQPIATPSISSNDKAVSPVIASEIRNPRRSTARGAGSSRSLDLETPLAASSQLATKSPLQRNQTEYQIPNPADGSSSLSLARNSAGGDAGPAARSSLPVLGSELLASQSDSGSELRAGSEIARRSARGNQAASLPQLSESGSSASPQWDGAASLSDGMASRSPVELAREGNGEANSTDVAGMYGAGREIQRAAVGLTGPQGRLSLPSAINEFAENAEPAELAAGAGQVQRASANTKSTIGDLPGALSDTIGGETTGSAATSQSSSVGLLRRVVGNDEVGISNEFGATPQRNDTLAGSVPKVSNVDVPNIDIGGSGDSTGNPILGDLGTIQRSRSQGRNTRLQIPLEIDARPGSGGLGSVVTNEASPLLPRRSADEVRISLPDFDVQKFARSEVGGPLASGTNVALPTPAFQQRLDRLENRSPGSSIDPRTELAIERGLEFLARYQRDDGSWRLQDFDTSVLIRSDTAATALALLAFQGAGYTHVQSKYATQVSRAIEFLAKNQKANGDLYITQDPASDQNGWLYSHAIASLALCEAYGMTQDEQLKPIAQRAINFMVSSQDPQRGGWRYRPGAGADTSVTGWYMMALQSGRLAGLNVPSKTFDSINSFIERAQYSQDEPHIYRYNPFAPDTPEQRHGLQPTAVMTSVGLLIRLYSGWRRENKQMMDGATYLLIHSPQNGTKQQSRRDTYYWYYATQVIFHMGGDYWKRWQDTLNPMLINEQVAQGRYAGSWDPNEPVPDLWARYGGRLYVTTMNLLSLEVSYRHLPLYEATSK
jgi:hypothetical protein